MLLFIFGSLFGNLMGLFIEKKNLRIARVLRWCEALMQLCRNKSKWIIVHAAALSLSRVGLFAAPCSLPFSSVGGESPGRNTGVGCHFFLQSLCISKAIFVSVKYLTFSRIIYLPWFRHCSWVVILYSKLKVSFI